MKNLLIYLVLEVGVADWMEAEPHSMQGVAKEDPFVMEDEGKPRFLVNLGHMIIL